MAYGAEFYNDNGKTQIASGQNNFCMVQKGSFTFTNTFLYATATPTVPYDAIAVAVDAVAVMPKGIFASTQAANTPQTFRRSTGGGAGNIFTWYAFRNYKSIYTSGAGSGWGIEIYNNDGSAGFTTANPKILKILKVPYPSDTPVSASVPAGRTYAFLSYGVTRKFETITAPMGGGLEDVPYYPFARHDTVANTVGAGMNRAGKGGAWGALANLWNGGILACDVTGY